MLWAEEQIFTNCTVLFPEHPISGKRVGTLTDIFYHIYYNKGTKDWRLKVLSAFHHGTKDLHCKTVTKYNRQNLDKAMNHFWDSWEEATMFNFVQNIAAYVRYKIRSTCLAITLWMARKGLRLGVLERGREGTSLLCIKVSLVLGLCAPHEEASRLV